MEKSGRMLDPAHTPFYFGAGFMLLGMLGILGGVIQYHRNLKRIKDDLYVYTEPWPLPEILAVMLLAIAMFGFIMLVR